MSPQTWSHKAVVLCGVLTKAVCFAGLALRPRFVPGSYLKALLQVDGTVAVLQQATGQVRAFKRLTGSSHFLHDAGQDQLFPDGTIEQAARTCWA